MSKPLKRISFLEFPDAISNKILDMGGIEVEGIKIAGWNNDKGNTTSIIKAEDVEVIKFISTGFGRVEPGYFEVRGHYLNDKIEVADMKRSMQTFTNSMDDIKAKLSDTLKL
jgi:hypothetical protein